MSKCAVVTGANKGIGFALVRKLAKELPDTHNWKIYLTSRNEELGQASLKKLNDEGINNIEYHRLDVTKKAERDAFILFIKEKFPNGVNIWVNNAGFAFHNDSTVPFAEQATFTNEINYFATVEMMNEALPIMAENSNLVNVSSMVSLMTIKRLTETRYNQFMAINNLTDLGAFVNEFIKSAQDNTIEANGWPQTAYGISKMALTKATLIVGESLKNSNTRNILVTSCCPGYVDTDMSSHKGPLTIEQGALTPFFCATCRDMSIQGMFCNNQRAVVWNKESPETIVTQLS